MRGKRWRLRVLFEPRDMWIGVFWTYVDGDGILIAGYKIYICLLPCFPICFEYKTRPRKDLR